MKSTIKLQNFRSSPSRHPADPTHMQKPLSEMTSEELADFIRAHDARAMVLERYISEPEEDRERWDFAEQ